MRRSPTSYRDETREAKPHVFGAFRVFSVFGVFSVFSAFTVFNVYNVSSVFSISSVSTVFSVLTKEIQARNHIIIKEILRYSHKKSRLLPNQSAHTQKRQFALKCLTDLRRKRLSKRSRSVCNGFRTIGERRTFCQSLRCVRQRLRTETMRQLM